MKTPLELAAEHARTYVRNRGWRCEPPTWEEVKLLLDELQRMQWNQCDCEDTA